MEPTQGAAEILERWGPTAGIGIALLAALLRPGTVEGLVRWIGVTIHGTGCWVGGLVERIVEAVLDRYRSTTRVNEALALALRSTQPGGAGTPPTPAEERSESGAGPGVGDEEAGAGGQQEWDSGRVVRGGPDPGPGHRDGAGLSTREAPDRAGPG